MQAATDGDTVHSTRTAIEVVRSCPHKNSIISKYFFDYITHPTTTATVDEKPIQVPAHTFAIYSSPGLLPIGSGPLSSAGASIGTRQSHSNDSRLVITSVECAKLGTLEVGMRVLPPLACLPFGAT